MTFFWGFEGGGEGSFQEGENKNMIMWVIFYKLGAIFRVSGGRMLPILRECKIDFFFQIWNL